MDITQKLDLLFKSRYDSGREPGLAAIIAKDGDIAYERYCGIADMSTGEEISQSTLFNIASVSKQFTVAALMRLGVDLNDSADKYFDFPQSFWRDITLADLAGHTSGLPDSRDRSDRMACVYADDASSILYFPDIEKLKFKPGTAYDYLNPSFLLLAKIIEQKTGEEFAEHMRRAIFEPLGMDSTVYFSPQVMPAHTAHGYVLDEAGEWMKYDYGEETFFATRPDGGIYSTSRDMLQWEIGLANHLILPKAMLDKAYAPRISVSDSIWCDYQRRPYTWYGLGWFVDTTPGRPVKVFHTGDNGGFQAYVAKYPSDGWQIIVLENRNDKSRWSMAKAIDRIIYG